MSVTKVLYKDVAPGAAEDATVSANAYLDGSDLSLVPTGISPVYPIITAERNNWLLDRTFKAYDNRIAFWSERVSGNDCTYAVPPVLTIAFSQQYSSVGITIAFDTAARTFCTDVNIKWYQGSTLKADVDFHPDATTYFCRQTVENYTSIVITLNKSNLPRRYAKIEHIIIGIYREIGMDEMRSASIVNQMGGCAIELPVSTFNWTLDSKDDVEFMFQEKQPIEVRNDNNLIGVYYIDKHKRKATNIYEITCQDEIGLLDGDAVAGDVYTGASAMAIITDIIGTQFNIVYDGVTNMNLTGIIEPGISKRAALQQVLFAWGVHAASHGTDGIRIFYPGQVAKTVPDDRIYVGNDVTTDPIVTRVNITARTYTADTSGSVTINGATYRVAETVYSVVNPNVTANTKPNVKEITGATLVSPAIGQAVAQRVYDYLSRRDVSVAKIVWAGETLGDLITVSNDWGDTTGTLEKMEITLSNTIAANTTAKGVPRGA